MASLWVFRRENQYFYPYSYRLVETTTCFNVFYYDFDTLPLLPEEVYQNHNSSHLAVVVRVRGGGVRGGGGGW